MSNDTDPGLIILNLAWFAPLVCTAFLAARLARWAWNR